MALTKAEWIWKDGSFVAWDEARVHLLSLAVQFGASMFEGIRCYDTPNGPAIFRLRAHIRRLQDSCRIYRMPVKYSADELAEANRHAIRMLEPLRGEVESAGSRVVLSGCVGPRGDGYVPSQTMSEAEAQDYHAAEIRTFADTAADMVTAITMNYAEEAMGLARAAVAAAMPVVVSFTVEPDGCLPTGQPLRDAVAQVDAATKSAPAYYMINCAHPTHFDGVLAVREPWVDRIRGLRANASTKSHAELNESTELDIGDPVELGAQYAALRRRLPNLNLMEGC